MAIVRLEKGWLSQIDLGGIQLENKQREESSDLSAYQRLREGGLT